jgi:hypothetical protein
MAEHQTVIGSLDYRTSPDEQTLATKVQHVATKGRLYVSLVTMLNLASREDQSR